MTLQIQQHHGEIENRLTRIDDSLRFIETRSINHERRLDVVETVIDKVWDVVNPLQLQAQNRFAVNVALKSWQKGIASLLALSASAFGVYAAVDKIIGS